MSFTVTVGNVPRLEEPSADLGDWLEAEVRKPLPEYLVTRPLQFHEQLALARIVRFEADRCASVKWDAVVATYNGMFEAAPRTVERLLEEYRKLQRLYGLKTLKQRHSALTWAEDAARPS